MFLNVLMLAGLSAAAIPVVLHLLNRARFRRVQWGAMMFLQQTTTRQLDRSRISQWLLLALRVLVIVLFALALARPVTRHAFGPADAQRVTVVLVIDASMSTSHPEQNATRLDRIRNAATQVLGELRRGDQVGLVTLGVPGSVDVALTTDFQQIASRLSTLAPGSGRADIAEGRRRASRLLDDGAVTTAEVYLIGDRQRATWAGLGAMPTDARARTIAVAVGSIENQNASIESVSLVNPPAVVDMDADVEIAIRNDAASPRTGFALSLSVADKSIDASTHDLAPGERQTVRRRIKLTSAGSTVVTASLTPTGMPLDDVMPLVIDVVEPLRVTVVTPESAARLERVPSLDFSGQADYFVAALTPLHLGKAGATDAFTVTTRSSAPWPVSELRDARVIVLAGALPPDAQRLRELEQFVFNGGGLLIAPSSSNSSAATVDAFNKSFWRDGVGVGVSPLGSIESTGQDAVRLVGISTSHPVFSFYAQTPDPMPVVNVRRWMKFTPAVLEASVATLQSGDPLLQVRAFGRGRVAVMSVPLDAVWSDWPLTNLYLPTMQATVRWLGSAGLGDRNMLAGAAIEAQFDSPGDRYATLTTPDGKSDRLTLTPAGAASTLIYTNTAAPGIYTLSVPKQTLHYAVRPDPDESRLDLQPDAAMREATSRAEITWLDETGVYGNVGVGRQASELSMPLLLLALALLGVELMLAQQFSTQRIAKRLSDNPADAESSARVARDVVEVQQ